MTPSDAATSHIVPDLRVGVEQLVLEIVEDVLVQGKLPLEGAIGHPAAPLKHGYGLVENLLKGHYRPSRCRCSVQKTVWELAQPFERMYTAHR
jgi:hypothetical protein